MVLSATVHVHLEQYQTKKTSKKYEVRLCWQEWFCCLDHANFVGGRSFVVVCGDYVAMTVMVVSFLWELVVFLWLTFWY